MLRSMQPIDPSLTQPLNHMHLTAIISVTLILFSVIDVVGNLPVILDLRRKGLRINPGGSTLAAGGLMLVFLFFGASVLGLFGIEVESFALAGALIIFFIGLEMTLGIRFFREEQTSETPASGTLVPIAFPLLAGAGTLTTIISLRAEYSVGSIVAGILINLGLIFLMLRSAHWLDRRLSAQTIATLRKVFGILVIAIAFQMFRNVLVG
jgi:multiple antibiotic resistance protein